MIGAVCSVPHTGTHFLSEGILRPMGWDVRALGSSSTEEYEWVWFHVVPGRDIAPDLIHAEYARRMHDTRTIVDSGAYPVLVPLRDPVLAVLSQMARSADGYRYRIDGHILHFERIARWIDYPNVHFVCVDQPRPDEQERVERFVGRKHPSTIGFATPEGERPQVWNPARKNLDLKTAYLAGEDISSEIGPAWDALVASDAIRTLFDAHGYSCPWMEV